MRTTRPMTIMSRLRGEAPSLFVADGRVACPRSRGDVDVDVCFGCPSFEGFGGGQAGRDRIYCRVPRGGLVLGTR